MSQKGVWPKVPPTLTAEQQSAREQFEMHWHQQLPHKYRLLERFNHTFPARLPIKDGCRTLEIGAGIGGHLPFEELSRQDYYVLEKRPRFCEELRKKVDSDRVICGDIETRLSFPEGLFDRVVAIHVLEHLRRLPDALEEISRVMKADGVLDVVLPCEGGFAYSCARKISAERMFEKQSGTSYTPITQNEHVSEYDEIVDELKRKFRVVRSSYFPLVVPVAHINLCVGMRLVKA